MRKSRLRLLLALVCTAAIIAGRWHLAHKEPPNVRTALGLKFTLRSICYERPYSLRVRYTLRDKRGPDSPTRTGLCELSIIDPSGKRYEPLERSDQPGGSVLPGVPGGSEDKVVDCLFEVPRSLDHVTVIPRVPLMADRDDLEIRFRRVLTSDLPATARVEKTEISILNAVPNKLPDPAEWKLESWDFPPARPVPVGSPAPPPRSVQPPKPSKLFALVVQWRFPDEYDIEPQAAITDDAGHEYQSTILYSSTGNYMRQSDAAERALAADGLKPTLRDKTLDKLKVKSLQASWDERAYDVMSKADARTPRLYLYVFPTLQAVPKRFSFKTSITPPAEVRDNVEVVFRNVPVERPMK